MQYRVTVTKTVEQDVFEDGCQDGTFLDMGEVYSFKSSDLDLVKQRLLYNFHLDIKDADEHENRLEISQMEDATGSKANASQIESWKTGRLALFCATYSIYLEKIEVTEMDAKLLQ